MEASAPAILELALLLLSAAAAGWAARRAGFPAVIGYLAVGALASPFTQGFVAHREQLELLANIGVILLLFEVGIEIDLARMGREQRALLWVAPVQLLATTALGTGVGLFGGLGLAGAALLGLAVGLSSSAVIVNITRSRHRTTDLATEHALLGWSVVQDVAGVILAGILISAMGAPAGSGETPESPWLMVLGMLVFIGLALGVARILPWVLRGLHDEHDMFLIVSVASGLAIAGSGALVFHIPMALAAFIAGLAITESHHAQEARRRLLPFRDLFAVFFFVVMGTLIDPTRVLDGWLWLAALLAILVVGKVGVAYLLARLARLAARPAQLAVGLGQIGEFS
ncbi:MAG: cation:proton antiporter, partial [Chloroflexota bacterium]|nr:cation:proton antiporter [Chloroflexota bacterium]